MQTKKNSSLILQNNDKFKLCSSTPEPSINQTCGISTSKDDDSALIDLLDDTNSQPSFVDEENKENEVEEQVQSSDEEEEEPIVSSTDSEFYLFKEIKIDIKPMEMEQTILRKIFKGSYFFV